MDEESRSASQEAQDAPKDTVASAIRSVGTTIVGLVMIVFGVAVVIPDDAGSNNTMLALGALVTALGAGIIATVLLPHKIEVGGDKVKPFGMDVKASGGAAIFVISLAFVYFSNSMNADSPGQAQDADEQQQADVDGSAREGDEAKADTNVLDQGETDADETVRSSSDADRDGGISANDVADQRDTADVSNPMERFMCPGRASSIIPTTSATRSRPGS